jgi:hypothetical protein
VESPRVGRRDAQRTRSGQRALLLAVICILARPTPALSANEIRRYEYRIAWNGIPAASATIEVASNRYGEQKAYVVGTHARTNPFVDLFWRFRGDARATVLADDLTPLNFSFDRQANDKPESTRISFDDATGRARSVYVKRERRKELEADARVVVDPITAALRALSSDVRVGDALRYDIFTGESHYQAVLNVVGEDRIEVPAGTFDALRVEPEVFKIGTERRPDNRLHKASIWVTRTPLRSILRIRSRVLIGAVTLDLMQHARIPSMAAPP